VQCNKFCWKRTLKRQVLSYYIKKYGKIKATVFFLGWVIKCPLYKGFINFFRDSGHCSDKLKMGCEISHFYSNLNLICYISKDLKCLTSTKAVNSPIFIIDDYKCQMWNKISSHTVYICLCSVKCYITFCMLMLWANVNVKHKLKRTTFH
jgi:hypothetical protein